MMVEFRGDVMKILPCQGDLLLRYIGSWYLYWTNWKHFGGSSIDISLITSLVEFKERISWFWGSWNLVGPPMELPERIEKRQQSHLYVSDTHLKDYNNNNNNNICNIPETNSSHLTSIPRGNEKVFQPSIFWGELLVSERATSMSILHMFQMHIL